jgi:predicted nucleic acid-binding protein
MVFISSDTNVWIDFSIINRIELPFYLPYTYIMNSDAINDELLSPAGLRNELLRCGLIGVDLTIEEFNLADDYGLIYPRLSIYDRIALAIAKERNIILLSGDSNLRKSAKSENVPTLGTIGILDQLLDGNYITEHDFEYCLLELLSHNGKEVRLPSNEINIRLQKLRSRTR